MTFKLTASLSSQSAVFTIVLFLQFLVCQSVQCLSVSVSVSVCQCMCVSVCVDSITVHPDRVTIATGQVAGHDKQEGKVSSKLLMLSSSLRAGCVIIDAVVVLIVSET